MSMEYCHDHHHYYDTDWDLQCHHCLYELEEEEEEEYSMRNYIEVYEILEKHINDDSVFFGEIASEICSFFDSQKLK